MSSSIPVVYSTPIHMLLAAAQNSPDLDALVLNDTRLSYREYRDAVAALAEEFVEYGARGARIATVLPNGFDTCIASYAAWAAGAQLVPLNPLYTQRELREILVDADVSILVCDPGHKVMCVDLAKELGIAQLLVAGPGERDFASPVMSSFDLSTRSPVNSDLALLQYTGGTTGRAKGVNLSHRALSMNVSQREAALPTEHGCERVLSVMPLFHAYGFSMALLLVPYCRSTLIIRERYHPADLLQQFGKERITIFPGAPTIFNGLVAHENFATTDFSSLHTSYSGSAPLAVETMQSWKQVTGSDIYEGYGQTEAGPVLAFNHVGQKIKPGTVGKPIVDTRIELVDTETGEAFTEPGRVGEIRAMGPQLMTSYRGLPEETAKALRNGWLYTGDLGEFDTDGYLSIRDRLKDMVIVGGYNVYPREVDEVLFQHDSVVDAAAVGAPDSYRGEVIRVFVVPAPDCDRETLQAALQAWCEGNLARYKCPVSIDILDALPKTTVNKTDKAALRARAAESYPGDDSS